MGERALALAEELHCRWFVGYCLIELGNVARAQGDYPQAKTYYQACEHVRRGLADPEGSAVALRQLGWWQPWSKTGRRRGTSWTQPGLYREIGDRGGLAAALTGLGQVALGQADQALARQRFAEALRLATEARLVPYTLATLVGVAQLLMESGQPRRGVQLLAATLQHPASDRETRERAQHLLDQGRRQLGPSAFEGWAAWQQPADRL